MRNDVYRPIVDALSKASDAAATVGELMTMEETGGLSRGQIWEALLVLTAANFVAPAAQSASPEEDIAAANALNNELLERAEATAGVGYLASATLGAAIGISRIDQLFVRAMRLQEKKPAEYVWGLLSAQGQRLVVKGKAIETDDGNIKELNRRFGEFRKDRVDILKRLEIL